MKSKTVWESGSYKKFFENVTGGGSEITWTVNCKTNPISRRHLASVIRSHSFRRGDQVVGNDADHAHIGAVDIGDKKESIDAITGSTSRARRPLLKENRAG
jgi:hypothetical protein